MTHEQAEMKLIRANTKAHGFIELALMFQENGIDNSEMRRAAIEALELVCNDDEIIDALYDADMRDMR